MRVWIDPFLCTGAGTCEQIAPDVFTERSDGTWAVKEGPPHFEHLMVFDGGDGSGHGPEGIEGLARVPGELIDLVVDAAEECPAECIYVEA